jgi:hypothetical protein
MHSVRPKETKVTASQSNLGVTVAKHPVRPRRERVNVAAAHKSISKRYPKTLAKLAK